MARKVKWTHTALRERCEIFDYWNRRNKSTRYSHWLRKRLQDMIRQLAEQPSTGALTEEYGIYRKLVRDYYLFYRFSATEITVISIWDTRRNPESNPYSY